MKIQSPEAEYTILRRLKSNSAQTAYLARAGGSVLLVCIDDPETIAGAGRYIESLTGSGIVIETFRTGGSLWCALEYKAGGGVGLMKSLRNLSAGERNEAARKVINASFSRDIPWPLLNDILKPKNIVFDQQGNAEFVYLPEFFPGYERDCRASCMSRLGGLLRHIYADTDNPCIHEYISQLDDMRFSTREEVCSGFMRVYYSVANMPEPEREKPALIGSLRELCESVMERAAQVVAAALLVIGYLVLARAIYTSITEVPITGDITSIGTVEIYVQSE